MIYKLKKDRLLLRIMSSQYSLVNNGVYVFFFDVTLFFANSACARGARGTPRRRCAPPCVCFLHLFPMRALPRTGPNLYTVLRCTCIVAPKGWSKGVCIVKPTCTPTGAD